MAKRPKADPKEPLTATQRRRAATQLRRDLKHAEERGAVRGREADRLLHRARSLKKGR